MNNIALARELITLWRNCATKRNSIYDPQTLRACADELQEALEKRKTPLELADKQLANLVREAYTKGQQWFCTKCYSVGPCSDNCREPVKNEIDKKNLRALEDALESLYAITYGQKTNPIPFLTDEAWEKAIKNMKAGYAALERERASTGGRAKAVDGLCWKHGRGIWGPCSECTPSRESDWFKALDESVLNALGRIYQDGYNRGFEDGKSKLPNWFETLNDSITRFEVIDENGRSYVAWPAKIKLSYQDDDRTLKIFINRKGPSGQELVEHKKTCTLPECTWCND